MSEVDVVEERQQLCDRMADWAAGLYEMDDPAGASGARGGQNKPISRAEHVEESPEGSEMDSLDLVDEEDADRDSDDEGRMPLEAEDRLELWRKLEDILQNQIGEGHKALRRKAKDQASMMKKFFKIWLPRDELDKFDPKRG